MNTIKKAYDEWSKIYDTNINRTRDLSHKILKTSDLNLKNKKILELGCGTGKVTEILIEKGGSVTGVDFSDGMLSVARSNQKLKTAEFIQGDLNDIWDFNDKKFDVIIVSLVLEHVENLEVFFLKCKEVITDRGHIIINEIHPYKHLSGSQAKYTLEDDEKEVISFHHSISEFVNAAKHVGFVLENLIEAQDESDNIPRILSLKFSYFI